MTPPLFWDKRILTVPEIGAVPISENNEPLVVMQDLSSDIRCVQISENMRPYVGDKLVVRLSVAMKLMRANTWLTQRRTDAALCLLYGYRHITVQTNAFNEVLASVKEKHPHLTHEEQYAKANTMSADPKFAGHPTGGAIDITLISPQTKKSLSMGTAFDVFSDEEKIPTFSSLISKEELGNRLILREALMLEGFAPFNGEWWHFSYGDRDWAAFYGHPHAIYDCVAFDAVKELLEDEK